MVKRKRHLSADCNELLTVGHVPSHVYVPQSHVDAACQTAAVATLHFLYLGRYISPDVLMSGTTRTGSARLNAYYGAKRQLIGTTASQVAPAWKISNGTGGPAAANGSTSSLPKKSLQRGSKILLSNLPMDVAEAEVEVGI